MSYLLTGNASKIRRKVRNRSVNACLYLVHIIREHSIDVIGGGSGKRREDCLKNIYVYKAIGGSGLWTKDCKFRRSMAGYTARDNT